MAHRKHCVTSKRLSPLWLPFLLTLLLAGLPLLPRLRADPWLAGSVWGAAGALLLFQLVLRRHVVRSGRVLRYAFVPVRVHYVQAMMQACVYAYWGWYWGWSPRQCNLAAMAVWAVLFITMMTTGFLGTSHPGADVAFWRRACDEGRWHGCRTWLRVLAATCRTGSAEACNTRAELLNAGRIVERNPLEAGRSFDRACDLGLPRHRRGVR
jgi:hypothetical protein